jgi:hypothetical protein
MSAAGGARSTRWLGDRDELDREAGIDRARHTPAPAGASSAAGEAAVAGRPSDRRTLGPRELAALQRLAGNGAVVDLIGRSSRRPVRVEPAAVQRDVDTFLTSTEAGASTSGSIGTTPGSRAITAHFFPGRSDQKALVVGGVHGSELSGIAVAEELVRRLSAPGARRPFFTVIIVPSLFPDALARRRAWEATVRGPLTPAEYRRRRDRAGDPGRITPGQVDPNRQMPAPGTDFDPANPRDARGRLIEAENQALLELIRRFSPTRIASLHAIKDVAKAGVYADPHPSGGGPGPTDNPLAAGTDVLAVEMARRVAAGGGRVGGNELGTPGETSLYPGQNPNLSAEQIERENRRGTTLGQWAPSRGIGVVTVELPEQYDTASPVTDAGRAAEIEAHAAALEEIFLGPPSQAQQGAMLGAAAVGGAKAVGNVVGGVVGGALGAAAAAAVAAAAALGLDVGGEER